MLPSPDARFFVDDEDLYAVVFAAMARLQRHGLPTREQIAMEGDYDYLCPDVENAAECEAALDRRLEKVLAAINEAARDAGYDPDDHAREIRSLIDFAEIELEHASSHREAVIGRSQGGYTDADWRSLNRRLPRHRQAYLSVYAPRRERVHLQRHDGCHRRAPGCRPVHRRGSRRTASTRGDPDDGDSDPPGVNLPPARRRPAGAPL